jgi:hypothetical protein
MTFQANIPLSTDLISVSQADILNNFQALSTSWQVNHVNFNSSGAGEHTQVSLIAPIADPNLATPKASLYTKASPTTITSDLYYQDGALASYVKQLTGGGITAAAYCSFDNTGALLPGSYNVSSTTRLAQGVFQVNFTRNFTSGNYIALPVPNCVSVGGFAIKIAQESKAIGSFTFSIQNQVNAFVDPVTCDVVFFGTLA